MSVKINFLNAPANSDFAKLSTMGAFFLLQYSWQKKRDKEGGMTCNKSPQLGLNQITW